MEKKECKLCGFKITPTNWFRHQRSKTHLKMILSELFNQKGEEDQECLKNLNCVGPLISINQYSTNRKFVSLSEEKNLHLDQDCRLWRLRILEITKI